MPNKMERFNQRARRVLSLAQEEAERLRHKYIGIEHLLLGLMREEGGVAGRVLRDLGLEQRRVEELVEELTRATVRTGNIASDLSPGTKRALEIAVDEARRMGHHYIGTEHLLLGLVRQSDGVAIDVLKRCGLSPDEVRRQTRKVLQESPVQTQPPTPPTSTGSIARSFALPSREGGSLAVVRSTILKILDMVEAAKLTLEQAAELLTALQPEIFLLPGEQAELVAMFKNAPHASKRRFRLVVTNKESGALELEMDVPLSEVLKGMDAIARAVMNNQTGQLWLDENDAANRIEIRVEEDKSASSGEGAKDAE
jgi:hypothetical protein